VPHVSLVIVRHSINYLGCQRPCNVDTVAVNMYNKNCGGLGFSRECYGQVITNK
jgi:hypothetical protein